MAKITWLGEDELHEPHGGAGPSFTHALGGIKFHKGKAVDVRQHALVQKALNNPFFDVDDEDDVDDAPDKPRKGGRPSNADKAAKEAAERAAQAEHEARENPPPQPTPGFPAA